MAMSRKARRAALSAVALALIAGNVWWFTRSDQSAATDFELGATLDAVDMRGVAVNALPSFDPDRDEWVVEGTRKVAIGNFVEHYHGDDVVDFFQPDRFVAVRMPPGDDAHYLRMMLLSLLRAKICAVAIFSCGTICRAG